MSLNDDRSECRKIELISRNAQHNSISFIYGYNSIMCADIHSRRSAAAAAARLPLSANVHL